MAIKIDLVADASKAIKEAGNLGDALEDIADNLKDVGKDGKTIDDKVGEAFQEVKKDVADAADSVDGKLGDAFRKAADSAKGAGKSIGDEVKHGTDKAGEGLSEMKDEAAGTAREAAASFSSLEDGADVLQETLANAFAGFGPAGMAAGILAAAGVGLVISQLTDNAEKINDNKEKMVGLAQTIRDNGGVLTEADYIKNMEDYGYAIQDTKEWWELFQDDAVTGFEQLRDLAHDTGLTTREIFRGAFGNAKEAQGTLDQVNAKLEELKGQKETIMTMDGPLVVPANPDTIKSYEDLRDRIQDNIQSQEDAALVESIRKEGTDSLTDSVKDAREEVKKKADADQEAKDKEADLASYVAGTTENYRKQADAIEEVQDALKGQVTTELDYLDKQQDLKDKLAETGNAWDVNTAKGRDNQRAVVDLASGIEDMARAALDAGTPVDQVTAKFEAQKSALVDQVLPAFHGNRDAAQEYIDKLLKVPPVAKTQVQLDKEDAEAKLKALQSPRGIPMHIDVNGQAVENWFISQQGRKVYVDFAPRTGGQAAMLP